jgi:hypothetical protein
MYLLKRFKRNILLYAVPSNLPSLEISTILPVTINNQEKNEQIQTNINGVDVVFNLQISLNAYMKPTSLILIS